MESGTFGKWLAKRGCKFVTCEDTSGAQGQAYVTVRCGHHQVVLPQSDPRSGSTPELLNMSSMNSAWIGTNCRILHLAVEA